MEQARQDIAPKLIGAQQVQMSLFNAKQMHIRLYDSPHFVRVAFDEEIHGPGFAGIFLHFEQKRFGIHGGCKCIGEWAPVEFALGIHEVENLWPAKQVIGSTDGRSRRG